MSSPGNVPGRKRWKSRQGQRVGGGRGFEQWEECSVGARKQEENEGVYLGVALGTAGGGREKYKGGSYLAQPHVEKKPGERMVD